MEIQHSNIEEIDLKDDESASSESSDTSEPELKSSISEVPPDGTTQAAEIDVDAQSTGVFRFSCPLPVHRWVQQVEVSDCDIQPLSCPARPSSPWGRLDPYDSQEDKEKEYVGFATLPNQIHRKSIKKGFEFTLMVVGESGLGKSTLINCLFLTDQYKDRIVSDAQDRINQTLAITKKTVNIVEKGVKLKLNIIDTPGFADAVDNTNSWRPVVDYIDWQFEQYHRGEISPNRKNILDHRVHCCLYFISPYGHGLRPVDVDFMKALHEKVNIVPVLAKADCLTHSESQHMKTRILNEIDDHGIKIFQFPECDSDEDEVFKRQDFELKRSIPFAVIGSNTTVECNGRRFRARLYPWGTVEVENPAYCDFVHLRNMLVRTHMQDLKDMTEDALYERYRNQSLQKAKAETESKSASLSVSTLAVSSMFSS